MPRTLRKSELWASVTQVGYIEEAPGTHGDTTVKTGGAVADVLTCPVTGTTNFTNGDPVFIGAAEQMEFNQINAAPADPMPCKYPVFRAHDAGEDFVEAVRTVLGDISDQGVTAGVGGADFTAVRSATKRLVQAYLLGHVEELVEFQVENWNLENVAKSRAIADSVSALTGPITGAGTSALPYRLVDDASKMSNASTSRVFYFTGATKGGGVVEIQAWGAEIDPGAAQSTYARGQVAYLPFRIRPCAGLSYEFY
jgi:hypothetical protein